MTAPKSKELLEKRRWDSAENEIIRAMWPRATVPEIEAALPGRTIRTIGVQAHKLGVKCEARKHLNKIVSPVFVRDGVAGKACVECLDWKPLEKFARHATCSGGRRNICMLCEGRIAYKNNPERCIAQVLRYQETHPREVGIHRANARARRQARETSGPGFTHQEIDDLFAKYGGFCAYCMTASADSIDHVIPLSRGGAHAIENILPACLDCNRRKHARMPEEWDRIRRGEG